MPEIVQYFIKFSVSLAAVYLFYWLILRPLTFYNWNRWYLLSYSLLCFFIPLIDISPVIAKNELADNTVIRFIPVMDNYSKNGKGFFSNFDRWDWLLILFLIGVIVMAIRLMIQYFSYYRLRRSASLLSDQPVRLYQVNKNIVPFSFGNSIFINQQQHTEEELNEIIRHEFIHVKQQHTIDILLSEIMCLFNWYNPFAWLLRKTIRQNLEFIADQHVLKNGLNKKEYQYLLLKVVGISSYSIGNQFNFSSLKKRIMMMNKMRTARLHLVKFLFILPLLAVLLLSFRKNIRELILNETKPEEINVQSIPEQSTGSQSEKSLESVVAPIESVVENSRPSISANKSDTSTPASARKPLEFNTPILRIIDDTVPGGKGIKVQSGLPSPIYGDTDLKIDASLNGPARPIKGSSFLKEGDPLFVLDGVVQSANFVHTTVDPAQIESITILKNSSATEKYGTQGNNGVIEIYTKKAGVDRKAEPVSRGLILRDPGGSPFYGIYIIKGKEYDTDAFAKLDLDPATIESVSVYKDHNAIEKYGEKGRKGVIEITLKKVEIRDVYLDNDTARKGKTNEMEMRVLFEKAQKEKILYIGISNPLNIGITGYGNRNLELIMENSSIQKLENGFYITPQLSPGNRDLKVYVKEANGNLKLLKTITYKLKYFPPPSQN